MFDRGICIGLALCTTLCGQVRAQSSDLGASRPVLVLLAAWDFDYSEYQALTDGLRRYQLPVACVSTDSLTARATNDSLVKPDLSLDAVEPERFCALVVLGGVGSARFWDDSLVLDMVKRFASDSEIEVAGIGLGALTLAKAGVLAGRQATGYDDRTAARLMKEQGVRFKFAPVVMDGRFMTATGSAACAKFTAALAARIHHQGHQER